MRGEGRELSCSSFLSELKCQVDPWVPSLFFVYLFQPSSWLVQNCWIRLQGIVDSKHFPCPRKMCTRQPVCDTIWGKLKSVFCVQFVFTNLVPKKLHTIQLCSSWRHLHKLYICETVPNKSSDAGIRQIDQLLENKEECIAMSSLKPGAVTPTAKPTL